MFKVDVFVDRAFSNHGENGSYGGYAAIIRSGRHEKVISGHEITTTTYRCELLGAIEAIKALTKPCEVTVYTESKYVADAPSQVRDWMSRGWKTKSGSVPKNLDLWRELIQVGKAGGHKIAFVHGRPSDREMTHRCASIAKEQRMIAMAGRGASV